MAIDFRNPGLLSEYRKVFYNNQSYREEEGIFLCPYVILINIKTTLLLFRCRSVIEQVKACYQIAAEEMPLWGCRGTPQQKEFLDHDAAQKLLNKAKATSEL